MRNLDPIKQYPDHNIAVLNWEELRQLLESTQGSIETLHKCANRAIQLIPDLSGFQVSTLLRVFSQFRYHSDLLYSVIIQKLIAEEQNFQAVEKISILLSFNLVQFNAETLLNLWGKSLLTTLATLTWKQLSNLIFAYSLTPLQYQWFFQPLEVYTLRHVPILTLDDLLQIGLSYARLPSQLTGKLGPTLQHELILRAFNVKFTANQMSRFRYAE